MIPQAKEVAIRPHRRRSAADMLYRDAHTLATSGVRPPQSHALRRCCWFARGSGVLVVAALHATNTFALTSLGHAWGSRGGMVFSPDFHYAINVSDGVVYDVIHSREVLSIPSEASEAP